MVRIAQFKYIDSGECDKYGQAVCMLMYDIEPYIQMECQKFWGRTDWRNELLGERVNAVIKQNEKLLDEVHAKYTKRKSRKATWCKPNDFMLEDAIEIFKDALCDIHEYKLNMCFPMSK